MAGGHRQQDEGVMAGRRGKGGGGGEHRQGQQDEGVIVGRRGKGDGGEAHRYSTSPQPRTTDTQTPLSVL